LLGISEIHSGHCKMEEHRSSEYLGRCNVSWRSENLLIHLSVNDGFESALCWEGKWMYAGCHNWLLLQQSTMRWIQSDQGLSLTVQFPMIHHLMMVGMAWPLSTALIGPFNFFSLEMYWQSKDFIYTPCSIWDSEGHYQGLVLLSILSPLCGSELILQFIQLRSGQ
jgi:hypothetical protein